MRTAARSVPRRCLMTLVAALAARYAAPQSLAWTRDFDGRDGVVSSEPVGPPGLAADREGNTYALSLANNGTTIGLLVKYSALGYQVWNRIERDGWPLAVTVDDLGRPTVLTPGRTLAYDRDGNVRWRADHSVADRFLRGFAIAAEPQGHVFVAGIEGSSLGLMRLDDAGRALWLRVLDSPDGYVTNVDGIGIDRNGRVYVAGRRPDPAQPETAASYFVAAFDGDGTTLWQRAFSGSSQTMGYRQDVKAAISVDPKGGAILSLPRSPFAALRTVRLDANGATLWSSDEAPLPDNGDGPVSVTVGEAGSVFVQGWAWGQAVVIGYDATGGRIWREVVPTAAPGGLVADATGRILTTWTEPGALRVIAYEASGGVAGSFRAAGGRLPPVLQAAGVVASPAEGARVQVLGQDLGGPATHLVLAFGPTASPDWAEVGWPYGVPSAEWALASRFDGAGNAFVLVTGARDRVLKYDAAGGLLWSQEPLRGGSSFARVLAFAVSPSGESVAVGADRATADPQPRVAKLDASGAIAWLRTDLLAPPYRIGEAKAAFVDARGAVYVAGWGWNPDAAVPDTRLFLCKYATDGQLLWRRFDSAPETYGYWPVLLTMAGGRIVVGGTQLPRQLDRSSSPRVWAVDESGSDVWSASPGEPGNGEVLTALVADSSGAVMAGTAGFDWASLSRGRLYRFGASGALEWSRSAPFRRTRHVSALTVDGSGEITVAYADPCILERLSPAGEQLWFREPAPHGAPATCDALALRSGGGFFVGGGYWDRLGVTPHGYLAAYDALGGTKWAREAGAPWGSPSWLYLVDSDSTGRVLTAGYAYRGATDYDALAQMITDDPPRPSSFYTVPPCRLFDSRDPTLGGPRPLAANAHTEVAVAGRCGVPTSARAVAVNLTAVTAAAAGHLSAFPAGRVAPLASVLNFGRGSTRATQATLELGDGGRLALRPTMTSGLVHVVVDVAGYFE